MMESFQEMRESLGLDTKRTDLQLIKDIADNFFYPNICQYCSAFGKQVTVKRCSKCHGVYYCQRNHQVAHRNDHRDFCEAVTSMAKKAKKECIFQDLSAQNLGAKCYLMDLIETSISRPLKGSEIDLFVLPRACIVCNESNPKLLTPCELCPHANFCPKHLNDAEHKNVCKYFTYCFYLDNYWVVFKEIDFLDFMNVLPRNTKNIDLPKSLFDFIQMYVRPSHTNLYFEAQEVTMHVSKLFCRPVTIIYALQRLKLTRCIQLQIHVICKNRMEDLNYHEWEILFHWFPKLKNLKIIMVGMNGLPKVVLPKLCSLCKGIKRSLKIETTNLMYKEFYNQTQKIPDLIVAFDIGYMSYQALTDAQPILEYMKSPIIFTGMTQSEILTGIQECVDNPNSFSRIDKNPYASLKLERNARSVDYSNAYISICGDNYPKISEVLLQETENTLNFYGSEQEQVADLEAANSLLCQKVQIFKNEIEKLKYFKFELNGLLANMKDINEKFFELEDKFFSTFGHDYTV